MSITSVHVSIGDVGP